MKRTKVKYAALSVFSFLFCMAPPILAVAMRWGTYTSGGVESMVRILAGIGVVSILVWRQLTGDKPMSSLAIAVWVFLLSWLLSSMLSALPLLSAAWMIGRGLYVIFFETAMKRVKRRLRDERTRTE